MPVKVTADEFAEKWGRRLRGATEDIRRGVEKVTEAPSKKAIEKKEKFVKRLLEAIESGRWEKMLGKVTLEDWKKALLEVGLGRISAGTTKAEPKMREFAEWFIPHIEEGLRKIERMPDVTLEDNINRMVEFIRHMASKKYKG